MPRRLRSNSHQFPAGVSRSVEGSLLARNAKYFAVRSSWKRLVVARLKLADRLADDGAADLAAADDGKHVVEAGQRQVRKIVQHEANGHGQPAAIAARVCEIAQA